MSCQEACAGEYHRPSYNRWIDERLHLTRPIAGWFGDVSVRLIDVSANAATIEHDEPVAAGTRALLRFTWRDHDLSMSAEVVAADESAAGLRFTEPSELLERLIAESEAELLRAQQANLDGLREKNVVGDETLTAVSAGLRGRGYVTWTLEKDGWQKRPSLLPDQPPNGFTVSAKEPADQVEILRQTWEKGDEAARRMTRVLAELSTANVKRK